LGEAAPSRCCVAGHADLAGAAGSSIPAWLAYVGSAEHFEGWGAGVRALDDQEEATMPRYMLLTKYDVDGIGAGSMSEWDPDDITAHLEFLRALNQELIDNGELVDMQALTGPELAKIVTFDGQGSPVVTDGPYTEVKEVLAGYQLVDVESEARAIEIAARVSAAPGPGGVPLRNRIEVRQLMGAGLEPGDL
jgi:hypothetical protein